MSLSDYKITDDAIAQNGVVAAPDKLTGTAAQNKAVFDRLIRESVKSLFNSVIDTLEGVGGASAVGTAPITGVTGEDVQTALGSLKLLLDTKSAAADTDLHIKSVSFNAATGVFTFTREDGSYIAVDTALEKVATNWQYDAETQSLVLTLADGSTQSVPLSAFITETEFTDSSQIAFSVSNHQVTATVKSGSITDTMLASALVTQLQGYVSSASSSASAALSYRDTASQKASAAASSAASAALDEATCSAAATSARSYAVGGTGTRTGENTDNAKYYCEQAEAAASGAIGVSSFNGRGGAVTPQAGDYGPSQVGASPEIGKGVNLVDNWYFVGGGSQGSSGRLPINQRMKTTYTGAGVYTIDRWKMVNSSVVELEDDCVRVTQNGAGTTKFRQGLEQNYSGTLTISVLVKNVSGTWTLETESTSEPLCSGPLTAGLNVITGEAEELRTVMFVAGTDESWIELIAVKLELGDHQTLARQVNGAWVLNDPPPKLELELVKAQRYFQVFRTQSLRPSNMWDARPPLRANPTATTLTVEGTTYYCATAE